MRTSFLFIVALATLGCGPRVIKGVAKAVGCPKEQLKLDNTKATVLYHRATCTADGQDKTYECKSTGDIDNWECALAAPDQQTEPQRQAQFNPEEYAPYDAQGSSSIHGQAFLKTRGGDVKYGAGNDVLLMPVGSYSTEIWKVSVVQGNRLAEDTDERFKKYIRQTVADGEGRFRFENLSSGEYYAMSYISWEVPSTTGLKKTGGWAGAKIKVGEGEKVETILRSVE
jgi:hypothetical protein